MSSLPGACSVRIWKRSSAGTLKVSTSARWTLSATDFRQAGERPVPKAMRERGMEASLFDGTLSMWLLFTHEKIWKLRTNNFG